MVVVVLMVMIMICEYASDGMRISQGNEVLGENLPQCHFVHHKLHMR
jgi:hypothetical protein